MSSTALYALPSFSLRFLPIWRRNFLVWKKLAVASVLGNIADPLITLIAFGYGLGSLRQVHRRHSVYPLPGFGLDLHVGDDGVVLRSACTRRFPACMCKRPGKRC